MSKYEVTQSIDLPGNSGPWIEVFELEAETFLLDDLGVYFYDADGNVLAYFGPTIVRIDVEGTLAKSEAEVAA